MKVAVTPGVPTLIVRLEPPRVIGPERMTPAPAVRPPKEKSPLTKIPLAIVRMVPSLMSEVPLAMLSTPVPIGPLVTAPEIGVELAPNISEPALRFRPVVKVLAPLRASMPPPALVSDRLPPFEMIAEISRPVSARPELTVMTGLGLLNCRAPVMDCVLTWDWLTEVTGLPDERMSSVPGVTVARACAPSLLIVSEFSVFVPTRVSVPPPLMVTFEVGTIWPELVTMTSAVFVPELTPLMTTSPFRITMPDWPIRFVVP